MVRDSVQIAEDVAADERNHVLIRYYNMAHSREETITSCEGDLIVICNVLADYADMLDEFLKAERESSVSAGTCSMSVCVAGAGGLW